MTKICLILATLGLLPLAAITESIPAGELVDAGGIVLVVMLFLRYIETRDGAMQATLAELLGEVRNLGRRRRPHKEDA